MIEKKIIVIIILIEINTNITLITVGKCIIVLLKLPIAYSLN